MVRRRVFSAACPRAWRRSEPQTQTADAGHLAPPGSLGWSETQQETFNIRPAQRQMHWLTSRKRIRYRFYFNFKCTCSVKLDGTASRTDSQANTPSCLLKITPLMPDEPCHKNPESVWLGELIINLMSLLRKWYIADVSVQPTISLASCSHLDVYHFHKRKTNSVWYWIPVAIPTVKAAPFVRVNWPVVLLWVGWPYRWPAARGASTSPRSPCGTGAEPG